MMPEPVLKMRDLDPVIEWVELTNGHVVGILPADAGADQLLKEFHASTDPTEKDALAKQLLARVLDGATPEDLLTLTSAMVEYVLQRAGRNIARAEQILGESSGEIVRTARGTTVSPPETGMATSVSA